MSHRGYPTSIPRLREKLESLATLPDDAAQWNPFIREEMRLAPWMLPAVRAAVREGAWRAATDPVVQLRSAVHRLAIEMHLKNADMTPAYPDPDEEE